VPCQDSFGFRDWTSCIGGAGGSESPRRQLLRPDCTRDGTGTECLWAPDCGIPRRGAWEKANLAKARSPGPVKANVQIGNHVDLLRIPAPLLHEGDGGRYINTFGVVIVRTPDKKWTKTASTQTQSGVTSSSPHEVGVNLRPNKLRIHSESTSLCRHKNVILYCDKLRQKPLSLAKMTTDFEINSLRRGL